MLISKEREFDAIIDQKLFGNIRFRPDSTIDMGTDENPCPFYLTDIAASWKIVERLNVLGYLVDLAQILHEGAPGGRGYSCTLTPYKLDRIQENQFMGLITSIADTAPRAVGDAAIKAIELNSVHRRNAGRV